MARIQSMFLICLSLLTLFAACGTNAQQKETSITEKTRAAKKVSVCEVVANPGAFDHKLLEVTGFVTRDFEDSILFDPACDSRLSIWTEVGGKGGTGVMYCCGFTPSKVRDKDLVVQGITVPLVVDEAYAHFDKALEKRPYGAMVRATLIGRFFSGKKTKYPNGEDAWTGFGHMGCCSLFAIQQVVSVDIRDQMGLDNSASVEHPNQKWEGCENYSTLLKTPEYVRMLDQQEKADSGERAWALDDPKRVAADELGKQTKAFKGAISELKEVTKTDSRIIYHWGPDGEQSTRFMIVINRPYWLSFYAKDPAKTAWVVAAAYAACG